MASPSNVAVDRIYRIPLVAAKRPGKYPDHALMRVGDTVRRNALLRRLAEHGHIKRPAPMFMSSTNIWGKRGVSYVDTVDGKEISFIYADYFNFEVKYRDGCFFPYVIFKGLTPEGERLNVPTGR